MDMLNSRSDSPPFFHWRHPKKPEDPALSEQDVISRFRWDKFITIVLFYWCITLHDCGTDAYHQSWGTFKIFIVQVSIISLAVWIAIKVVTVMKPELCYYSPDPFTAIYADDVKETFQNVDDRENKCESYTQTDGRHYRLETKRMERLHRREMRRLKRQLSLFRRKCCEKRKEQTQILQAIRKKLLGEQLKLLPLSSRKEALLSEKEDLETLLLEEKDRHQDLQERFSTLNKHLSSDGKKGIRNEYCLDEYSYRGEGNEYERLTNDLALNQLHTGSRVSNVQNEMLTRIYEHDGNSQAQMPFSPQTECLPEMQQLYSQNSACRQPVRFLYTAERGADDIVRYLQVTPNMYVLYEAGKGLLPESSIGQMEVIAAPQPDGTLQLLDVKRFSDGFPKDKLYTRLNFQTFEEFRRRIGLPVATDWSADQVQFRSTCDI